MTSTLTDDDLIGQVPDDYVSDDEPVNDDAPYGVNPRTGKPYRDPPDVRAARVESMLAGRRSKRSTAPPPLKPPKPRATGAGPAPKGRPGKTDYRPAILALAQLPVMALGLAARFTGDTAYALDAATVQIHAPALAEIGNDVAQQQQWAASLLDKVLEVSPYGNAVALLMPLALQFAANHGKLAPNPHLGILAPEELEQAVAAMHAQRK